MSSFWVELKRKCNSPEGYGLANKLFFMRTGESSQRVARCNDCRNGQKPCEIIRLWSGFSDNRRLGCSTCTPYTTYRPITFTVIVGPRPTCVLTLINTIPYDTNVALSGDEKLCKILFKGECFLGHMASLRCGILPVQIVKEMAHGCRSITDQRWRHLHDR